MIISDCIKYVGVNDKKVDLFEGHYKVPSGMAYNSYVLFDEKTAVFDTVDKNFTHEWLDNLEKTLQGRKPDYLIVSHMEPDHSANIVNFLKVYKSATVVASEKAFVMMSNFFGGEVTDKKLVVKEGDTLSLGKHVLHFVAAPMVHWPEVMMSYEETEKVLFSADAFGKFGAVDGEIAPKDWVDEARRYYIGIVGKYGAQVQNVLKKAAALDIKTICPLHGPVLKENLGFYLNLYNIWSSYTAEKDGVAVFYTSVYGNTKQAAELTAAKLKENGSPSVVIYDLARCDMAQAIAEAFAYPKIVLATTTYNTEIFPFMKEFLIGLAERNFCNKTIGLIENGSWAPLAAKVMKGLLEGCKNISFCEHNVKILSGVSKENKEQIDALAKELCQEYIAAGEKADDNDPKAMFKIGYGLYVVTTRDNGKDNGLIVNTVTQVTSSPNMVAVTVNKQNYSQHIISKTREMNVNCLSVDAPFSVFEKFGFKSGRETDKFAGDNVVRSSNGLVFLQKYVNAFMSLKVVDTVDLPTHVMFICEVTEARVLSDKATMTYDYYQQNVKPKPETEGKKGYVCKVCGFVYEGDELPDDYVCPLCKHGAADFEPIK